MDKEEIIRIIRDEVSKEFGAERIKGIRSFGPHEGENLDVPISIERARDAALVALAAVFPCPMVAASSIAGELAVLGAGGRLFGVSKPIVRLPSDTAGLKLQKTSSVLPDSTVCSFRGEVNSG